MARQDRFSLSDWLMLVAVILVIAGIAMPNWLRPAANEAAAIKFLFAINSAQLQYAATKPNVGFACTLSALAGPDLQTAPFADPASAGGSSHGYVFSITECNGAPATSYLVVARPVAPGKTGVRVFCSDQTGIVRFTPDIRRACTTLSMPAQ